MKLGKATEVKRTISDRKSSTTSYLEALEKERFKNAAFIGRTERTLDRLCAKFKILRVEVDGDIRIRKSELLRYLGS